MQNAAFDTIRTVPSLMLYDWCVCVPGQCSRLPPATGVQLLCFDKTKKHCIVTTLREAKTTFERFGVFSVDPLNNQRLAHELEKFVTLNDLLHKQILCIDGTLYRTARDPLCPAFHHKKRVPYVRLHSCKEVYLVGGEHSIRVLLLRLDERESDGQ